MEHEIRDDDPRYCVVCYNETSGAGERLLTHCPGVNSRAKCIHSTGRPVEWADLGNTVDFINGVWVEGELSIQAARVAAGLPATRSE